MIRIRTAAWNPSAAWVPALVICLSIAASPAFPATPAAPAVSATPLAQAPGAEPLEALDALDEVVVRGKRLRDEIADAEDEFYKIFNDVNKDDRYDTHCVYVEMDRESRMQSRACIPGFVADAMADWAPFKARCQPPMDSYPSADGPEFGCLDRNHDRRLSLEEISVREDLAAAFFEVAGDDAYISGEEFRDAQENRPELASPPSYMPPSPDAILANGSKKWYDHMTEVTNSDPRLHKMADHLGDLYHELSLAQHRYDELDAEAKAKAGKRNTGPRVH